MNVEIGTEAAQFSEKEYIYVILLAVQYVIKIQNSPYFPYHTVAQNGSFPFPI
jgi:hypothetical protein